MSVIVQSAFAACGQALAHRRDVLPAAALAGHSSGIMAVHSDKHDDDPMPVKRHGEAIAALLNDFFGASEKSLISGVCNGQPQSRAACSHGAEAGGVS